MNARTVRDGRNHFVTPFIVVVLVIVIDVVDWLTCLIDSCCIKVRTSIE